jgi:shikimate kinase
MMLDQYCADALSLNGHVFCLSASIQEIQRRYTADEGGVVRPLLAGTDETKLRRLYEERATAYSRFEQVETEGRSIDEVVEQIELLLRNT